MPCPERKQEAHRDYLPASEEVRRCYPASAVLDYRVGEGHCPRVEIRGLRNWAVLEIQLLHVSGCPQLKHMPLEREHTGGAKEGVSEQGLTIDQ